MATKSKSPSLKNEATPISCKITQVVQETPSVHTIFFEGPFDALPGQFVMLWLPGCDQKPFTLSSTGANPAISFRIIGEYTRALAKVKAGDKIGITGPFGNGFSLGDAKSCIIVAGGIGIASLIGLIELATEKKIKTEVILGARTKGELLFEKRIEQSGASLHICTDDGTAGHHGFTTEVAGILLQKQKPGRIFACGPELMMNGIADIASAHKIPAQLSLERYMKCGFGMCGACEINGLLVCKDGPVFSGEQVASMPDFGNFARLKSGKKVSLKEYYATKK
jgi:dihydroorotate dehydrogenase electron transfer subunit